MKKLTPKQQAFAVNKAAGIKNKEAAIAAGYASTSAHVQASALMQRPDIKAAIKAAKKKLAKGDTFDGVSIADESGMYKEKNTMPKASYTDSKDFLLDAMNHKHLPVAARADYAKALLPYQHARMGEVGKKESAKDRAKGITGEQKGKRERYAPKQSPKLHAIQGGKQ